jgi:hypothetical protein
MDKVRKPNISESYTPSSESYSNYLKMHVLVTFTAWWKASALVDTNLIREYIPFFLPSHFTRTYSILTLLVHFCFWINVTHYLFDHKYRLRSANFSFCPISRRAAGPAPGVGTFILSSAEKQWLGMGTSLLTYWAEPFLRSYQLCSHSGNFQQS